MYVTIVIKTKLLKIHTITSICISFDGGSRFHRDYYKLAPKDTVRYYN